MAVGTLGSATHTKISADTANGDASHTVTSGTTLLVLYIFTEGDEAIQGSIVWDSAGVNETLTLINDSGAQTASDVRVFTYGRVSPTDKTATMTVRLTNPGNPWSWIARNYDGTVVTSLAAATNHLSDDVNTAGTSGENAHASAGSAGNALVMGAAAQGADMSPATQSVGTTFTEVVDDTTGADNITDFAIWYGELLNSAPSAITIDWSTTDQNSGTFLEIVAAAGGGGSIHNQIQGSNLGADLYNGTIQ